MLLQEDLVQMVPMISETNAMAEELDKKVSYSDKNCYLTEERNQRRLSFKLTLTLPFMREYKDCLASHVNTFYILFVRKNFVS